MIWYSVGRVQRKSLMRYARSDGPGVLGNTDGVLWTEERLTEMSTAHPKLTPLLGRLRELIAPMRARIGEERLRWLKTLPATHMGDGFAVVHASPKDLWRARY